MELVGLEKEEKRIECLLCISIESLGKMDDMVACEDDGHEWWRRKRNAGESHYFPAKGLDESETRARE